MTCRDLIRRTAEQFSAAGVPDPVNDAALLLSHLTGLSPLSLRLADGRRFRLEFDCKHCQMNVYAMHNS